LREVSCPTVSSKSTLLTAVIEAEEGQDVATCDTSSAFIQIFQMHLSRTRLNKEMKMEIEPWWRAEVYLLISLWTQSYPQRLCGLWEWAKGAKCAYHEAIYGLLVSAMLFCQKLMTDLTNYGFGINPNDLSMTNKEVEASGTRMISKLVMQATRLLMNLMNGLRLLMEPLEKWKLLMEVSTTPWEWSLTKRQVSINMIDYAKSMVENFPSEELTGGKVASPWSENLFKVNETNPWLPAKNDEQRHTWTAQGLLLCKHGWPDICSAVAYLTTRVRNPNQDDWNKLMRMMRFLKQTMNLFDIESRWISEYPMACRGSICSPSRFQEPYRRNNDNGWRWQSLQSVANRHWRPEAQLLQKLLLLRMLLDYFFAPEDF
jgi:hypothetical protein